MTISVNATRIIEGNKVAITANLFNTVDQRIKVSAIYNWPFYGLNMVNQDWPPCYSYSPLEFTVLKGNFSSAEVRAMGPGGVPVPFCMEGGLYSSFAFEPNSEYVYATGEFSPASNQNSTRGPLSASVTIATNGYWDNGTQPTYPTNYCGVSDCSFLAAQHPFVRGVFTIAVADEWGSLDVVHIAVLV